MFSAFLMLLAAVAVLWLIFWASMYIIGSPWALGSYVSQRRNRRVWMRSRQDWSLSGLATSRRLGARRKSQAVFLAQAPS